MNFFINDAMAQGAGAQGGSPFFSLFFLIGFFVLMWFMLIRPQQKRQKEHRKLIDGLSKGDEIVTSGGIAGKITEVNDHFVTVDVGKGVQLQMQRVAVVAMLPKGTIKQNSSKN